MAHHNLVLGEKFQQFFYQKSSEHILPIYFLFAEMISARGLGIRNLCQHVLDGKECRMNGKKVGWRQHSNEKEMSKKL